MTTSGYKQVMFKVISHIRLLPKYCMVLVCGLVFGAGLFSNSQAAAQEFDLGSLIADPENNQTAEPKFEFKLNKKSYQLGEEALFTIKVTFPEGGYTYSQENQTGTKPRFTLSTISGLKPVQEKFQPDRKPLEVYESVLKKNASKFYESVTWTRKFQVDGSSAKVQIAGRLDIPICDKRTCRVVTQKFNVQAGGVVVEVIPEEEEESSFGEDGAFGEEVSGEGAFGEEMADEEPELEVYPLQWNDTIRSLDKEVVNVKAELVEAGELYELKIIAEIADSWHVYSTDPQENARPAEFKITNLNGLEETDSGFVPDRSPEQKQEQIGNSVVTQKFYKNQIVWTKTLKPVSAEAYKGVSGTIRLQTCQNDLCLRPSNFEFQLGTLTPGTALASDGSAGEAGARFETYQHQIDEIVIPDEKIGFTTYLLYAFLGGLILNAMPCVLPVLAIKILSFVKQAGEDRSQIIALNSAYSAGVIAVFMILATLAVVAGYGWGELFQKTEFNLFMTCFIFAMSLSLLGLYEIPIPGLFGAASGQQKEGLTGAFFTGVFATLLATPCSGPFLGVTLAWSVQQPPQVTYLIWFTMGLGMASPYLIVGLFPGLISWLPKPGNWMVRMKELAGFILLGTVIFLFSYIEERFKTPLLVMLLGAGFALSIIGRAPANLISRGKYWFTRLSSIAVLIVICGGAYWFGESKGHEQLNWQPFSTAKLMELRDEGKTVLIDFSAEWCISCKTVEQVALNTKLTKSFVDRHDVVTLYADYTDGDPEIKKWLEKFESESIPLTVIFPANRPNHPIILRDLYFQGKLLLNLQKAVNAREVQTARKKNDGTY